MNKNRLHFPHRQRGISMWGGLFAAVMFVSGLTLALSLGPHYVDYQVLQGIFERLPADRVHNDMTKNQIREHFDKQFRIENFRFKTREIMTIDRNRERTVVSVDYEIREPLAYNIDVVLSFSEQKTFD